MTSSCISVAVDARRGSAAVSAERLYRVFSDRGKRAAPASQQKEPLRARFRRLVSKWQTQTALVSSTTQLISHPAYLEIIGMGDSALPLIFEELRKGPHHWGPALAAITGVQPITADQAGDMQAIADTWLAWARTHGY